MSGNSAAAPVRWGRYAVASAAAAVGVRTGVVLAVGALGGAAGTGLSLLKIMTMSKLKASIVGALVVAGVATPLVISHQTQSRLLQENKSLREQVGQLSKLAVENESLSNEAAQAQMAIN